jgi:carbon-monoxide dehydrogenase small subunit
MTTSAAAPGLTRRAVSLTVNGVHRTAEVEVRRTLADFLRHDLGLTVTHVGCEPGVSGACPVLLDGLPVRSCLLFAVTADGHAVTTIEGLGSLQPDGTLQPSPVQQAFRDCHALQCGFCTPGMLTTITAGLKDNPHPTAEQAVEMISGNLCRCTGYQNIVEAVLRAAELMENPDAPLPDEGFTEDGVMHDGTTTTAEDGEN